MVTILKKGTDKQSMETLLKKAMEKRSRKGLDASKYGGTVKFKEDGLIPQKRWRDEWE